MQELMNNLMSYNLISRDNEKYYVNDINSQGFPRLMINIKDDELYKLAKSKHIDQFKSRNKYFSQNEILQKVFANINDIEVKEIKDKQPDKVAFKKILGSQNDLTERMLVYGKNKQTLFAALKRQLKSAPLPEKDVVDDFIKHSIQIIEKEMGEALDEFGYDTAQWYNHLNAQKQSQINPIYNYYNHPEKLLDYSYREIQEILSFHYTAIVKSELQELDGKPRMVCSIPQHIKYIMGPVTWTLEELAVKNLRGYIGGFNLTEMKDQLNDFIKQGFVKVVEGDGSAFDNTQDISLKQIDRYIYNRVLPKIYHVDKSLFEQVANTYYKIMDVNYRDQYNNKKVHTYVRYYVLGTVFSGDCDTTLMNTIRMVLYNRYVNDKAGLVYGKDYVVFAKGDDFSVLYKNYVDDDFIDKLYYKYFLPKSQGPDEISDKREYGLGQVLKFLDKGDPSTFKFCSLRSWFINDKEDEITLTRDPSKLYNKALYSIKYKSYNAKQKYMYHIDQAISYKVNYNGINIFEIMGDYHFAMARRIKNEYNLKINKKEKQTYLLLAKQIKLAKKVKLDQFEFTEDNIFNKLLSKLFDIKSREKYIDYYTNYWEQTQLVERARNEVNSINELKYINDQIEREFDIEELKSLLAPQ
jgi:hypothetical protein